MNLIHNQIGEIPEGLLAKVGTLIRANDLYKNKINKNKNLQSLPLLN
jgi:hypothetical protein